MNTGISLRSVPFFRLLVPYILGISLVQFNVVKAEVLLLCLFSLLAIEYILIRIFHHNRFFRLLSGWFISFLMCTFGVFTTNQAKKHHTFPKGEIECLGIVSQSPQKKPNSLQADCRIIYYIDSGQYYPVHENVRLYLAVDSSRRSVSVGDSVFFRARMVRITNSGNPEGFDYAAYMGIRRIFYTAFVSNGNYIHAGFSGKFPIRRMAGSVQKRIIASFTKHSIQGDELAVLSALVAGNRNRLEEHIRSAYVAAGVMHILAVSGLHVGILYLFLSIILLRNYQTPFFRFVRVVIILLSIWFFAFITGLSSSVVRAALMFSLFLLGTSFNRPVNSYNILAASAFIILVVNPLELFKVGFQFSYLAVMGILYFQPKLEKIIRFKGFIPDKIWQLVTVSIAAQLSTFPLSLYYFHQFPVWFWFTNILVIPTVWLVMVFAILFFLCLPFDPVSFVPAVCVKTLVKWLNLFIKEIGQIPFSTITGIRFERIHLIFFYAIIIAVALIWISERHIKHGIYIIALSVLIMLGFDSLLYFQNTRKQEIVVYNDPERIALSLIKGHHHLFITESAVLRDTSKRNRNFQDFWTARQISSMNYLNLGNIRHNTLLDCEGFSASRTKEGFSFQFCGLHIYYLDTVCTNIQKDEDRSVRSFDFLLLGKNAGFPESRHLQLFEPKSIIITNVMPPGTQRAWVRFAEINKIDYHLIRKKGALYREISRK